MNHDLRHLRAVLQKACDWNYLREVPKFDKEKEAKDIGRVVTPADFEAIYASCAAARMPKGLNGKPDAWWQALLVFAITSGWRIGEILSLRREDFDLTTGKVTTRSADNKSNREAADYLPQTAIDHVRCVIGFEPVVFFWPHDGRTLDYEF